MESTGGADVICSLGLLEFGGGVLKNPSRAQELYAHVIENAETSISYCGVRLLVDSGNEGLPAEYHRMVKLRTREAAMYSLCKLLITRPIATR